MTVDSAGIFNRLNVHTVGQGRPIVTVHGGPGYDHTSFRPWLDPLAAFGRIVYYDHPGNGRAAPIADWASSTLSTYIEHLALLHQALATPRMVLFGHSFGGFVALEYALRFPERVAGLVLCNTGPTYGHLPSIIGRLRERATPDEFAAIMAFLADLPTEDEAFAAGIRTLLPFYVHRDARDVVPALFGNVAFRAAAFAHGLGITAGYDVTARLPSLTAPVLVVASDDDLIFQEPEGPAVLASLLPNAELLRFSACGHYPFAEQSQRFLVEVGAWLDCLP